MIVSIQAYKSFIEIADNYNYLVDNYKQDPIYNLTLKQTPCEKDETYVFAYDFPGTNSGCDCSSANRSTVTTKIGQTCSVNQTKQGCKSVPIIGNEKLVFWDNGNNIAINL